MTRLERAARRYAKATRERETARDQLADEVRAACNAGTSEVEAAKRAGVTRATVRAWRGV